MICWMSLPRTARFAYAKSSVPCESSSATRSAQPRWPPGTVDSGSPMPSVKESPRATYRDQGCCCVTMPSIVPSHRVRGCRAPPLRSNPVSTATPSGHQPGTSAAEHLSPSFPERAAWGTASKLRAWQAEALEQYLAEHAARLPRGRDTRRRQDHLRPPPRGGAAGPADHRPHHRRGADRPPEAPVGGCRGPRRHPARPGVPQRPRAERPALPRRRRDLRAGGDAAGAAPRAHDLGPHPRDPRRGAPRRRRALVGRRDPRGVRAGDQATLAHRNPVPLRHRADPVRALRTRRAGRAAVRGPTTTTAMGAPSPTASCARCSS